MEFTSWLTNWLRHHPLRTPTGYERTRYTADVMGRVNTIAHGETAPQHSWWALPRLAFAVAAAAAGVAIAIGTTRAVSSGRLAKQVAHEAQLLAALDEPTPELNGDVGALTEELKLHDTLVLAEAQSDDTSWIEQTMQLLNELDDQAPADSTESSSSDEEWMNDLQLLENSGAAAHS